MVESRGSPRSIPDGSRMASADDNDRRLWHHRSVGTSIRETKVGNSLSGTRGISPTWTGFYVKHEDDAYAVVSSVRSIEDGSTLGIQLLEEFSRNPADQGGSSFLGLFTTAPDDMLLFTFAPTEFFRISAFGALKDRLPVELRRCTG